MYSTCRILVCFLYCGKGHESINIYIYGYLCTYANIEIYDICINKCIHIDVLILTLYSTMYVLCRAFNDCCKLTSNESLKSLCRTFFLDTRNDCHYNKYPGKRVEYVANSSSETRWKCLQWQQQAKTPKLAVE